MTLACVRAWRRDRRDLVAIKRGQEPTLVPVVVIQDPPRVLFDVRLLLEHEALLETEALTLHGATGIDRVAELVALIVSEHDHGDDRERDDNDGDDDSRGQFHAPPDPASVINTPMIPSAETIRAIASDHIAVLTELTSFLTSAMCRS